MSIDTADPSGLEQTAYGNTTLPKKESSGSKKWFACCGIGCLVLVLLCGIGAAVLYFTVGEQVVGAFKAYYQNVDDFLNSDIVKEKLGTPISDQPVDFQQNQTTEGNAQLIEFRMKFRGAEKDGYLVFELKFEPGKPMEQTKFLLEVDGEEFDLTDPDEKIEVDIDDGFDDFGDFEDSDGTGSDADSEAKAEPADQ